MSLIIDRLDGDYAVCEADDGSMISIGRNRIPIHAVEGDILIPDGESYRIDREAVLARRQELKELLEGLFEEE